MVQAYAIYASFYIFQWFEEKQNQIEILDQQLKKLHVAAETLVTLRRGNYYQSSLPFWNVFLLTLQTYSGTFPINFLLLKNIRNSDLQILRFSCPQINTESHKFGGKLS